MVQTSNANVSKGLYINPYFSRLLYPIVMCETKFQIQDLPRTSWIGIEYPVPCFIGWRAHSSSATPRTILLLAIIHCLWNLCIGTKCLDKETLAKLLSPLSLFIINNVKQFKIRLFSFET